MERLYSFVYKGISTKRPLYVRGGGELDEEGNLYLHAGEREDFLTYFNSFSLMKWCRYTCLQALSLEIHADGEFSIEVVGASPDREEILVQHKFSGETTKWLVIPETKETIVGVRLIAKTDCCIKEMTWCGSFKKYVSKRIGIAICTYRREQYVKKTMELLKSFQKSHDWLDVLVVDNGQTLSLDESNRFRVIHNPNYGGSGGFTRGMMEYVQHGGVDYVLLMDDDIELDTSVLERTHSLLSGIQPNYQESFLGGAMLDMQYPLTQVDNTAYWNGIRVHALGKNDDISTVKSLVENEHIQLCQNQYPGWWFCAIPLTRIKEIGYPLPVFLKGDDMEYGIRNQRPVMNMNGIGVWHEAFANKTNDIVNYFSDRNMLILDMLAEGCPCYKLMIMILGRLGKRMLRPSNHWRAVRMFALSLHDFRQGFLEITSRPADEKFVSVKEYAEKYDNLIVYLRKISWSILTIFFQYHVLKEKYRTFRQEYLCDEKFWQKYLKLKEKDLK